MSEPATTREPPPAEQGDDGADESGTDTATERRLPGQRPRPDPRRRRPLANRPGRGAEEQRAREREPI